MARRGENIYKRKDGRYEGRFIKGHRLDGKPVFGYIYGNVYSEVKARLTLAKAAAKQNNTSYIIGNGTLGEFLIYWLSIMKNQVKPSTYARYHERIYGHLIPALGQAVLSKLTKEKIQDFVYSLRAKGLAASTISGIVGLLQSALKRALELHLVSANPCDGIKLPQSVKKEARVLSRQEQILLEKLASVSGVCLELAVFLALYAGLRIGEICALKWRDIDFFAETVTVRGTLQRVKDFSEGGAKTKLLENLPKSESSARVIPLPAEIMDRLSAKSVGMQSDSYVLTGTDLPVEPRTLRSRFAVLTKKAGLSLTFHSLRHTYATRCLEYNFDLQTLSELLGHSDAGVTMRTYAHSVLDHKRQLASRMCILSETNKPSDKPSTCIIAT